MVVITPIPIGGRYRIVPLYLPLADFLALHVEAGQYLGAGLGVGAEIAQGGVGLALQHKEVDDPPVGGPRQRSAAVMVGDGQAAIFAEGFGGDLGTGGGLAAFVLV